MKQKLSREENRRAWLIAVAIVVLMAVAAGIWWSRHDARYTANTVRIAGARPCVTEAAAGLDAIDVALTFDPSSVPQVTAVQTLTLTNRTGCEQAAIVLRSYTGAYLDIATSPNASDELYEQSYGPVFSAGGLLTDSAQVDGAEVTPVWCDDARTVLALTPETPWLPGETRTVTLAWHAYVPALASRFGLADGVWALGNLFPTPAVWLGDEWDERPVTAVGDPFVTACANWTVSLTAPAAYMAAASAYAEPTITGDTAHYRWEAPAMRDFTLVLSDRYVRAAAMEGDTAVIAYAKDRADAQRMVKYACQALRLYGGQWGEYVYPALTLCEVTFPYGGMEYPGLAMIGSDRMTADTSLEYAVAHETAHQWWAVQVGSDSFAQPWQDESLALYAVADYIGRYHGAADRAAYVDSTIEAAMRITIPGTITPASPLDYFSDMTEYTFVAYDRGAALWVALENLLGKDSLDAALRTYQQDCRFTLASREDLTALLSAQAGMDLAPLMTDYLDTLISN